MGVKKVSGKEKSIKRIERKQRERESKNNSEGKEESEEEREKDGNRLGIEFAINVIH